MSFARWRKDRKRAEEALDESRRNLEEIKAQDQWARELRVALARIRRENHLGPTFDEYLSRARRAP